MRQNNENQFALLKDQEEEYIETESNSSQSTLNSSPSKSSQRVQFEEVKSIQDLLNFVIKNFKFSGNLTYSKNYWDCNLSKEAYSNVMTERLHCFMDQEENPLVSHINSHIDTLDSIDPRPLLEQTINDLSIPKSKTQKGQASLFLLGLIFVHRPDLITPEIISFEFSNRRKYAPIVSWLIQKAIHSGNISHLDPLLSTQLLDIFIDHLSDPAISLSTVHLLSQAFSNQNVWLVSSQHFCKLLAVAKSTQYQEDSSDLQIESIQNIERQIKDLLSDILPKLVVSDKKDLANQLISTFPEAPDFSCELFIKECASSGNATFLDGWLETHSYSEKHEYSMNYLAKIAPHIEETHLHQFPIKDLLIASEITELLAIKWKLANSSFRLIFLAGIIILFILLLHHRWNLF